MSDHISRRSEMSINDVDVVFDDLLESECLSYGFSGYTYCGQLERISAWSEAEILEGHKLWEIDFLSVHSLDKAHIWVY